MNNLLFVENIDDTVVKPSDVHGMGLFACREFKKGTLLCTLTGQILPKEIYEKFSSSGLPKDIFIEKSSVLEDKILAIPFRTSYSFINHHPLVSHIEEKFCNKTNQIFVYAKVDIKEGEEILDTYNLNNHIDVLGGFNQNYRFKRGVGMLSNNNKTTLILKSMLYFLSLLPILFVVFNASFENLSSLVAIVCFWLILPLGVFVLTTRKSFTKRVIYRSLFK